MQQISHGKAIPPGVQDVDGLLGGEFWAGFGGGGGGFFVLGGLGVLANITARPIVCATVKLAQYNPSLSDSYDFDMDSSSLWCEVTDALLQFRSYCRSS